jgi:hypothetical protein
MHLPAAPALLHYRSIGMAGIEIIRDHELVSEASERMTEIMGLTCGTQSEDPVVEYSAHCGVAATIIAMTLGIQPTRKNLSVLLPGVCEAISEAVNRIRESN